MVSPKIAIKRRGGEGRLVTERYIAKYNEMLLRFYETIEIPKVLIETSKMDVYESNHTILSVIKTKLL